MRDVVQMCNEARREVEDAYKGLKRTELFTLFGHTKPVTEGRTKEYYEALEAHHTLRGVGYGVLSDIMKGIVSLIAIVGCVMLVWKALF